MSSDVSRIKERLNIIDVVGEYVRLSKAGAYYKARCPFHEEKTPSFVVNEDRQTYHCFGCDVGGDILSFIMEMEGMEFRDALKMLAERAGIELSAYTPEQKEASDQKARLYELMERAVAFYEKQLWASDSAQATREYLHERGLSDATLKKFQIGFAPEGWDHLEKFLIGQGYSAQDLVQTGMSIAKDSGGQYDRFRGRIMFPITDALGRTIGFSARVAPGGDEAQAKYINTPESPLYHKSDVLYGIALAKQAIKKEDAVIIVEGNVDVIAAHEAGIDNVVAVSGTALTEAHIKVLKRYTTHFILFFDADAAGQKAARRSTMTCFGADVQIALVALDTGKDAADLVAENPEKLRQVIGNAQDALTFFITMARLTYDVTTPHGKRQAIESVLALAATIDHPVERDAWVKRCTEEFDTTIMAAQEVMRQFEDDVQIYRTPEKHDEKDSPPRVEQSLQPNKLISTIFLTACAFPEAWKELCAQAEHYPFIEKQEILRDLVAHGAEAEYDIGTFIERYPAYAKLYKSTAAFRSHYEKTYEKNSDPQQSMQQYLERADDIYHHKQIEHITMALHKADKEGDTSKRDRYMKKLHTLTQKHSHN